MKSIWVIFALVLSPMAFSKTNLFNCFSVDIHEKRPVFKISFSNQRRNGDLSTVAVLYKSGLQYGNPWKVHFEVHPGRDKGSDTIQVQTDIIDRQTKIPAWDLVIDRTALARFSAYEPHVAYHLGQHLIFRCHRNTVRKLFNYYDQNN